MEVCLEPIDTSATALARAIAAGELSALEAVDACLRRIEQVNPLLCAVVALDAEAARAAARAADRRRGQRLPLGPLHGVPVTIKDSLDTVGLVTTWGSQGRRGCVPARDATVVARLRGAGAIVLGKTNTPELTMAFETVNPLHGRTANPFDVTRTSGGSSGGAAACVAAGGAALDLGSDTGGSIRVPAHFCGVAGLRPTSGRVPRTGHAIPFGGFADSLTTLGPLARRVEDLELALRLVAGPDGEDPFVAPVPLPPTRPGVTGLRVAFHVSNGLRQPDAAVAAAVQAAAKRLEEAGCAVEEARPPGIEETLDLFGRVLFADGGAFLRRRLERAGTEPELSSIRRLLEGPALGGAELAALIERWDAFRGTMLRFLDGVDAILCPPCAIPACPHGDAERDLEAFSYTMTWSLTGWPAAVVRVAGTPEGLPIGVQLVAAPWREDVALALAGVLEEAFGGWRPPPL